MEFDSVVTDGRVEIHGKPKSLTLIFITFSLMTVVIAGAGLWFTLRNEAFASPGSRPLFAAMFTTVAVVVVTVLFFAMRREFKSMVIDRNAGEIVVTWLGLFGTADQTMPLSEVKAFSTRHVPTSARSSGWLVDVEFKQGGILGTGTFHDETATREFVAAANSLISAD